MNHILQFIVYDSHGSVQVPPCTVFFFLFHLPHCHSCSSFLLVLGLLSLYVFDIYLLEKISPFPDTCVIPLILFLFFLHSTQCVEDLFTLLNLSPGHCLTVGLVFHSLWLPHFTHLLLLLWASNSSQELSALWLYNFSRNFLIDPQ